MTRSLTKSNRLTWIALAIVLAAAIAGGVLGRGVQATSRNSSEDMQQLMRIYSQALNLVEENYADQVKTDQAVYTSIQGMLRTLDPHSTFFDPKGFSAMREEQRGKYYGVGMQVANRNGRTVVIAPFVGSPAYKAGIRPGDVIWKVNGVSTEKMTTSEVADRLKGVKGTLVQITILREGSSEPLEFSIVRDEIPRHSIEFAFKLKDDIGYLRINNFNETTDKELAEKLKELDPKSLKGLILDLRDNPGGLLQEGIRVADTFLEKGQLIVFTKGRSQPERQYQAPKGNQQQMYPLVVLINQGSASAAEIVAGAIQDHDRGLIVGETSFGKGLVQQVYPLDQNTGLALTVAKWYTPSGRLIQREYANLSFFDYYNPKNRENSKPTEIKLTDSGRQVFGGGGIHPDYKVAARAFNDFETLLLQRFAFFNFASHYSANHPKVTRDFQVTEEVLQAFRKFLDNQKIQFTEAELQQSLDYVKRGIKTQLFVAEFGQVEGYKVSLEGDEQLQKAIELLPKAKELAEGAKRIIASKINR